MFYVPRYSRSVLALAVVSLGVFLSACAGGESDSGTVLDQVQFTTATLSVSAANPGAVIEVDVTGSQAAVDEGFFVRFTEAGRTVDVPPLHVENGRAFVIVPGFSTTLDSVVTLSLTNLNGQVVTTQGPTLTVKPVSTSLVVSRELFNTAVGEGLARLIELARESVVTLDQNGHMVNAQVALDALAQQQYLLRGIASFTSNLSDAQLAMLQQILGNSKLLDFLAAAGNVSFGGSASQASPQYSVVMQLVESALLKADFACLLLGEARGMLALISWVCTQVSSWPIIGSTAQSVAAWAQGLSATLKTPQDFINSMIPSDLVRVTANPTINVPFLGNASVVAKGRFETEKAFNTAWLQQQLSTWATQATSAIQQQFQQSPVLAPYAGYVQQVGALVPGWIMNWLTARGLLSASVVPGQSYTVFSLNNLDLDMSTYRFDIAGIVANLLNLPRNIVTTFFNWVGIGYGRPVGGFEGVKVNGSFATYNPATDRLQYVSHGTTTANYIGVLCRPASGWWAQWGFYTVKQSSATVTVIVN